MTDSIQPRPAKLDLEWIKQALQTAIEIETSTLPLYLAAMFSLKFQAFSAYLAIRNVAMEEMIHMAIAANMLSALGGKPQIRNIKFLFPVQGLPGGVEPDLHVGLAKLSELQLDNFMRIEMPEFLLRQLERDETYPTIAAFYSGIRLALLDNADAVRSAVQASAQRKAPPNQVADNIGIAAVNYTASDPLQELLSAIDTILEQGEGASAGSLFAGDGSEDEMCHYARFAEIRFRASYEDPQPPIELSCQTIRQFFRGRKVPWPEVVNTLAVPSDGYARILALDPNATTVTADLQAFDNAYSSILAALDDAWNGAPDQSWKTLGGSVHSMVNMRVLSCFNIILRHQIPNDIVRKLPQLYPDEIDFLNRYTDLAQPASYGPRFLNTNAANG